MEPNNTPNFSGMNVNKVQQMRQQGSPSGGGMGKMLITLIVLALIVAGAYFGWKYYMTAPVAVIPTKNIIATTSSPSKIDNATNTASINSDLDTASNFDNSNNLNAIDQEFK